MRRCCRDAVGDVGALYWLELRVKEVARRGHVHLQRFAKVHRSRQ